MNKACKATRIEAMPSLKLSTTGISRRGYVTVYIYVISCAMLYHSFSFTFPPRKTQHNLGIELRLHVLPSQPCSLRVPRFLYSLDSSSSTPGFCKQDDCLMKDDIIKVLKDIIAKLGWKGMCRICALWNSWE